MFHLTLNQDFNLKDRIFIAKQLYIKVIHCLESEHKHILDFKIQKSLGKQRFTCV